MKSSTMAVMFVLVSAVLDLWAAIEGRPSLRGAEGTEIFVATWLICRAIEEK